MARIKFLGKVLFFVLLIGGWVAVEAASPAAPSWPKKDISFVVPFKPGGGFDIQSRTLAPFLEKYLPNNVNVVIKNVTGAGGKAGIMEIARSKPDGYTIGAVGLEAVSFMRAMGELDVDIREWSWLGQLSSDPQLITVPTTGKYKTLADMKGQDIRYGVTAEMVPSALILGQALGMKVRLVLFDGVGDAIMALMRNDLDVLGLSWPTMSKGVRDSEGKISSLFVASKSRLPALKDVPTLGELGVQLTRTSASVLATTRLVAGPKGLGKSVRESLESALAKTMKDPEFLQRMEKAQQMAGYANSATVQANIASALEAYTSVKALVEPFIKK